MFLFVRRFVILWSWLSVSAFAGQEGFTVIAGEASAPVCNGSGGMTVHSKDKAILHWDKFSIPAGETFRFQQMGKDAAVLNRVLGGETSQIMGALTSNGRVYLINPNGVLIGPGGRIETAGFVASALDVLNADFISEKSMLFSGEGRGSIVNLGTILCESGHVALIGRVVRNDGTIQAPRGKAGLGAGAEVLLCPEATPYLYIRAGMIDGDSVKEGAALMNEGSIQALAVELKSGASVYEKAIQCKGIIDALNVAEVGGEIYLVADEGWCDVQGQVLARNEEGKGGIVHVLGRSVSLSDQAVIDVSGTSGGGEVLIGGELQGGTLDVKKCALAGLRSDLWNVRSDVMNAEATAIGEQVRIQANATQCGNGGKVIVWAEEKTYFWGSIDVTGGPEGGDGGFAEVSGNYLAYEGLVDCRAALGKTGDLWLDPADVTVSTGEQTAQLASVNPYNTDPVAYYGSAENQVVNTDTLTKQLDSTNVTIMTYTQPEVMSVSGGAITVSSPLTYTSPNQLTLIADSFLQIDAPITNSGSGNLIFSAFGNNDAAGVAYHGISFRAPVTAAEGNIAISGEGSKAFGGRGVDIGKVTLTAGGTITFEHCIGGGAGVGGSHGVGIHEGAVIAAEHVIAVDCFGGMGNGNDVGFFNAGTIGSARTKSISITAESFSTGTAAVGIRLQGGKLQVGDGGTIALQGTGGGSSSATAAANYGVELSGTNAILLGTATGAGLNTLTITGIGGAGTEGAHHGVHIDGTSINLNGTNVNNGVNFTHCVGGTGGEANHGIHFKTGISLVNGTIHWIDVRGGSSSAGNHYGVDVQAGQTVSAPSIMGIDLFGGPGINANYGLHIAGTLGSAATSVLSLSAGSLGTGTNEHGIFAASTGSLIVGAGGTMTLKGTGGGLESSASSGNHGIVLDGASFFAGNASAAVSAIALTGIGGQGGSAGNDGVHIAGATEVTFNGTGTANTLNFLHCTGGFAGSNNYGINVAAPVTVVGTGAGTMNCINISGGGSLMSGSTGNHGIRVASSFSAPSITLLDVTGGPGVGTSAVNGNFGLFVETASGIFGGEATTAIHVRAGSVGQGSFECGIVVDNGGTIQIADGGTMVLSGSGGGAYDRSASANNYGIFISSETRTGGTIQIGHNLGGATATLTGIGGNGAGAAGQNNGVQIAKLIAVKGSNNTVIVANCIGGAGGSGGATTGNYGVNITSSIDLAGNAIQFKNCSGGSSLTGGYHFGVNIASGQTVTAATIVGAELFGGVGRTSDYGLNLAGTLGSSSAQMISLSAGSLGTGTHEYGIFAASTGMVVVGAEGRIVLNGTGGGASNSGLSGNHGIVLNGARFMAGDAITLTGIGGQGGVEGNYGVDITAATAVTFNDTGTLNFLNCVGGFTGSHNYGINIGAAVTVSGGVANYLNISGGGSLTSGSTNNHGIRIASLFSAPSITLLDVTGGPGMGTAATNGNFGLFVETANGLFGGSATTAIQVQAGSLGQGSFECGIVVDNGGTIQIADSGTMVLSGTGGGDYNHFASANNYGIFIADATGIGGTILIGNHRGGATATLSGIGGSGAGVAGQNHGIQVAKNITLNGSNNTVNFANCMGGSGGDGSATTGNCGVYFASSVNCINSAIKFNHCSGGSSVTGGHHYGVNIGSGQTVAAATIVGSEIFGGAGSGSNYGLNVAGTLGSTSAYIITISAGSLGTGANEYGIFAASTGSVIIGPGGTVALYGRGGGGYNSDSSGNHGIVLNGAHFMAGNGTSAVSTIALTGIGGQGGTLGNYGLHIGAPTAITFNGTGQANALNFVNCVGGVSGSNNYGINVAAAVTVGGTGGGTTNFLNVSGGGNPTAGSTSNHGIRIADSFSAPMITLLDVTGGPGIGTSATTGNFGLFVETKSGLLGGAATRAIHAQAGSMGQGSFECGIVIADGAAIQSGGSGAMTLCGSGGSSSGIGIKIDANSNVTTSGNLVFETPFSQMICLGESTITAGEIAFNGAVYLVANTARIFSGGDIAFNRMVDGAFNLTVASEAGNVLFNGPVGATTPVGALAITGRQIVIHSNLKTTGAMTFAGPVLIGDSVLVDASTDILFRSRIDSRAEPKDLTLKAGGAVVFEGSIGQQSLLDTFHVESALSVAFHGSVQANNILVAAPATVHAGEIAFSTVHGDNVGNITVSNALDGAQAVVMEAGSGQIFLNGPVGIETALTSFTVRGSVITQTNQVRTSTGDILYAATVQNKIGSKTGLALQTISGGNVHLMGQVLLSEATTIDTSRGNGHIFLRGDIATTIAGASLTMRGATQLCETVSITADQGVVTFDAIDGCTAYAQDLTIDAGTIHLQGNIGDVTALGALRLSSSESIALGGLAINAASITINGALFLAGAATEIRSNHGEISFSGAINGTSGNQSLTLNAGTGITRFGDTVLLDRIALSGPVVFTGNRPVDLSGISLNLAGDTTINTGNADVVFGPVSGSHALLLDVGTGSIFFTKAVSDLMRLTIQDANAVTASIVSPISAREIHFDAKDIALRGGFTADVSTFTHTGALMLAGPIRAGTFSESGGGTVHLNSMQVASASFDSPVSLVSSTTMAAGEGNVAFFSSIDGPFDLTISSTGTVTMPQVGSGVPLDRIAVIGPATQINIGGNQTVSGGMIYNGPLQLTAAAELTNNSTTPTIVNGTITASQESCSYPLTLRNAQSGVLLQGDFLNNSSGNSAPFLIQAGGAIACSGSIVTSGGEVLLIVANGSSAGIAVEGLIDSHGQNGGRVNLITNGGGSIRAQNIHAYGGDGGNGGNVLLTALGSGDAGSISVGEIWAGGGGAPSEGGTGKSAGTGNAGSITIIANGTTGAITVGDLNATGGNRGGIGGNLLLQPNVNVLAEPYSLITLNGTIMNTSGNALQDGFIALSPTGRAEPTEGNPGVATIVNQTGRGFTIHTGTLLMGPNECFTILNGNLNATATSYLAVGGIIAAGPTATIALTAPNTFSSSSDLLEQPMSYILDNMGSPVMSDTAHIIAPTLPIIVGSYASNLHVLSDPALETPSLVMYQDTVLNYSAAASSSPVPSQPQSVLQINQAIATTQNTSELLSFYFPLLPSNRYFGQVLFSSDQQSSGLNAQFHSFLPENEVK